MVEYRISKNRDEIIKLVKKKIETSDGLITVWQKNPDNGERNFKYLIKLFSIDIEEGTFSIYINEVQLQNFNPKLETYFLLQSYNFVFKTKISIRQPSNKNELSFKIPSDARMQELRLHARAYIESTDRRFIVAKFKSKRNSYGHVLVSCPVFNISEGGICIIVTKETLSNIDLNQEVIIEGLSFYEPLASHKKMKAMTRNARIYTKQGLGIDESYALGLQFLA